VLICPTHEQNGYWFWGVYIPIYPPVAMPLLTRKLNRKQLQHLPWDQTASGRSQELQQHLSLSGRRGKNCQYSSDILPTAISPSQHNVTETAHHFLTSVSTQNVIKQVRQVQTSQTNITVSRLKYPHCFVGHFDLIDTNYADIQNPLRNAYHITPSFIKIRHVKYLAGMV